MMGHVSELCAGAGDVMDHVLPQVFVMSGRMAFTYGVNGGAAAGAAGATLFTGSGAGVTATEVCWRACALGVRCIATGTGERVAAGADLDLAGEGVGAVGAAALATAMATALAAALATAASFAPVGR